MKDFNVKLEVVNGLLENAINEVKEDLGLMQLYKRVINATDDKRKKDSKWYFPALLQLVNAIGINQKNYSVDEFKTTLGNKILLKPNGDDREIFNMQQILKRLVQFYIHSLETPEQTEKRVKREQKAQETKEEKAQKRKELKAAFEDFCENREKYETTILELKKEKEKINSSNETLRKNKENLQAEMKKLEAEIKKLNKQKNVEPVMITNKKETKKTGTNN